MDCSILLKNDFSGQDGLYHFVNNDTNDGLCHSVK